MEIIGEASAFPLRLQMTPLLCGHKLPVGAEIAGCLVEAQGCGRCGCLLDTGTAGLTYPGHNGEKVQPLHT